MIQNHYNNWNQYSNANWNKYQLIGTTQGRNQYLDYLIDPSFQGVNRVFVWTFEDNPHRTRHTGYFLQEAEIKDYNVMIDGQYLLNHPAQNDLRTYDNIQKITIGQVDD